MSWTVPGTLLQIPREEAGGIADRFGSMFLAGGMVLSQISQLTGLAPYTVQNWVKRGFLSPPVRKRYSMRQLCRILNINTLKGVLPMERICGLLGYVNGRLDDESDDLIDDAALYFLFVRLAADTPTDADGVPRSDAVEAALASYAEPYAGAKQRVARVLRLMLTAYGAACLRDAAESQLAALEAEQPITNKGENAL